MPEKMEEYQQPAQISQMFQKLALSFKSKAFEFFSDDSDEYSLLEKSISDQNDVVVRPESESPAPPIYEKGKRSSNAQFNQTLITSLFATISSFEASYLHLQTAHVPNFDEDAIKNADNALVSHLQTLSEFKQLYKNYYQNPNFNIEFSTGSCLEFQVNENQHKLRALKSVFNRLQSEIDVKDAEVSGLRRKLEELQGVNLGLLKKLSCCSSEKEGSDVLLTVKVFDKMLRDVFSLCHKFTKVLLHLMKNAGWDLDLAANSVYSNVDYAKKGHNRYALLSYVCLRMFQGFDLEDFGFIQDKSVCNGHGSISKCDGTVYLKELKDHVSADPIEILRKNPTCEFSRFCERKYQQIIHPTMESSIFNGLDQNQAVLNSWKSLGLFYELFVKMASSVWALHRLAFSFDPPVDIFQVERGVDFSMVYMEDVTRRCNFARQAKPKVGFTVVPGFKIGQTVVQSQVYLAGVKSVE